MDKFTSWIDRNQDRIQKEYFDFLKFKSIGTDPQYKGDTLACACWVRDYLSRSGMQSELIETVGHPVVFAENLHAGPSAHTLLIYGHYDVQPVDPIELWHSPPFEPEVRDGIIYARGAVDDKGQIFYAMQAVLAFKELEERLPINLKFCIEGEEESGSLGLTRALPQLKSRLKCDSLLVPDFDLLSADVPAISLGARGIVTLEVTLIGSDTDLHSGLHGGLAYNPNRALVELLAQLYDADGHIQVPGFYDDVELMNEEEKNLFSYLDHPDAYKDAFKIRALGGEKGRSMKEANWFRPTLEINGIAGGYAGPGFKTVIPSRAHAKISCRLVPNQDPEKIGRSVAEFLRSHVARGMEIDVQVEKGERAFRSRADSRLARAVSDSYSDVMGQPCRRQLTGGSIPIIAELMRSVSEEVVGMGYGLLSDQIHAPNEHFDMQRFNKGIRTVAQTIQRLK